MAARAKVGYAKCDTSVMPERLLLDFYLLVEFVRGAPKIGNHRLEVSDLLLLLFVLKLLSLLRIKRFNHYTLKPPTQVCAALRDWAFRLKPFSRETINRR